MAVPWEMPISGWAFYGLVWALDGLWLGSLAEVTSTSRNMLAGGEHACRVGREDRKASPAILTTPPVLLVKSQHVLRSSVASLLPCNL